MQTVLIDHDGEQVVLPVERLDESPDFEIKEGALCYYTAKGVSIEVDIIANYPFYMRQAAACAHSFYSVLADKVPHMNHGGGFVTFDMKDYERKYYGYKWAAQAWLDLYKEMLP